MYLREGGMNAASSSHKISPPDPLSVFDAAGYELTTLRVPSSGCRMTRISALLFTIFFGSKFLLFMQQFITEKLMEFLLLMAFYLIMSHQEEVKILLQEK